MVQMSVRQSSGMSKSSAVSCAGSERERIPTAIVHDIISAYSSTLLDAARLARLSVFHQVVW